MPSVLPLRVPPAGSLPCAVEVPVRCPPGNGPFDDNRFRLVEVDAQGGEIEGRTVEHLGIADLDLKQIRLLAIGEDHR